MASKRPPMKIVEQIVEAYLAMVRRVKYAPAAPSDGWGNLMIDDFETHDHRSDGVRYAHDWWTEEDDLRFYVGCPDYAGRPALIHTIEAARLICGLNYSHAAAMLRMAADELEGRR